MSLSKQRLFKTSHRKQVDGRHHGKKPLSTKDQHRPVSVIESIHELGSPVHMSEDRAGSTPDKQLIHISTALSFHKLASDSALGSELGSEPQDEKWYTCHGQGKTG